MTAPSAPARPSFATTLKTALGAWLDDRAPTLAGALSFSTIFALAPLFVIIMALTGHFISSAVVEQHLVNQVSHAVGSDAASALRAMVDASHANAQTVSVAGAIGWVVLLGAAAGIFLTLQDALNIIWHVDVPKNQPFAVVLRQRAAALAMVFAMALLIVLTLAVDALLAVVLGHLEGGATAGPLVVLGQAVGTVFTILATAGIFAMAFKVLPQAHVAWHDVWPGAVTAAVLFVAGQWGIALFLAHAGLQKGYGAAGSVLGLLMWVYVSAMVLFFGAEITKQSALVRRERQLPRAA